MSGNGAQTGMTKNIMKSAPVKTRKGHRKGITVLYGVVVGAAKIRDYVRLIVIVFFQPAKSSALQASVLQDLHNEATLLPSLK